MLTSILGLALACGIASATDRTTKLVELKAMLVIPSYDPIVDLIGMKFGLYRPVACSDGSPEDWHWERIGANTGDGK